MIKLAPPNSLTQLSHSCVLWFEASNQYIVVPSSINALLDVYYASGSALEFENQLQSVLAISSQDSKTYYAEISELLKSAHTPQKNDLLKTSEVPQIEKNAFKDFYSFGNMAIRVNYGSLSIKNFIHPQWAHAADLEDPLPGSIFDIFQKNNSFYLFKNKNYIGHYALTDFHLLQGQFALQVINTIYRKNESDWIATFHASTVCNDKEAIMIIGDSGNGKSTLSAVLMAEGYDVLADDFSPLAAANQQLYRFPSGISVKEGAFKTLAPLFPDFHQFPVHVSSSKNVNLKYIPPEVNFGQGPAHFPCKKIVYVKYKPQSISEMKAISIEKILETLIPESWISPKASNSKLFLEWLKELSCYELTYSDNTMAISQIRSLFKS